MIIKIPDDAVSIKSFSIEVKSTNCVIMVTNFHKHCIYDTTKDDMITTSSQEFKVKFDYEH